MANVRTLPRGFVRGPGPRTWAASFVIALAALSGSVTLLLLTVTTVVLEDPGALSPVQVLDSLPPLVPRASTTDKLVTSANAAGPAVVIPLTPPTVQPSKFTNADLQAAVDDAASSQGGGLSISLLRIEDGASASIDGDDTWYSASLFKLSVLYEVERQIDAGKIRRDDRLVITDADLAEDLGTAWDLPFDDHGTISIEEALDAMVTHSDNTTAVALLRLVGSNNIDATLSALGLKGTRLTTEELPTTANDMAVLMEALATGHGLTKVSAAEVRTLLLDQETRIGIPSGAPDKTVIGNKTGNWAGATHDVAFIESAHGTYILAILTGRDYGWETISNATWHIFNALDE